MDMMSSGDESDAEPMSTDTLEDICDGNQSHPSVNRRDACYKICDIIKQSQAKWKEVLLSTWNMRKGLHKVFKDFVHDISQALPILVESSSEASYFIPEPRNFADLTRLSEDINKPWLKATLK